MLEPESASLHVDDELSRHRPRPVALDRRESTILVVGGAGYIGSILSANLLDDGYHVIVLDPLLYGGRSVASLVGRPRFELHVADTRDEAVVKRLLSRVGAVIHCGEIVGDPACDLDPAVTISVNYTASVRLAELAAQAGVARFIYPSSCSVYGASDRIVNEDGPLNPVSLYGRVKRAAEEAILGLGDVEFHPTVFRLATVYGISPRPRFDLVVNTLAGRASVDRRIVVQGGGQWRPFVHVSDVAQILARSLRAPLELVSGEVFNLGSNAQNHTIGEIAEIVRERIPDVQVDTTDGQDRRNYRVAFDKLAIAFDFEPSRTIGDGIAEILSAVSKREIRDIKDPRHSNVRALVETVARRRLWREDLGDSRPTNPFRPRDVEALEWTAPATRAVLLEDAVS